jgi:hypothetical protein
MQEQNPNRKLNLCKPDGTQQVSKPVTKWLDSVEENLKTTGIKNLRQNSQDWEQWRASIKEAKVHNQL